MAALRVSALRGAFIVRASILACAFAMGLAAALPTLADDSSATRSAASSAALNLSAGYNLVGWVGDATNVLDASSDIADSFGDLRVYDRDTDTFLRFVDGAPGEINTLDEIPFAAGVWVAADGALAWAPRPAAASSTVGLEAGQNLVAWLGADGTAIADAVAPLGDSLVSVHVWDSASQRFQIYAPDAPAALRDDIVVDSGDGLWVNVSRAVDWSQTPRGADAVTAIVDASGASVAHASGAAVAVPAGALVEGAELAVFSVAAPANLPDGFETFGDAIGVSAAGRLEGLATVRLPLPALPAGVTAADAVVYRVGRGNFPQDVGGAIDAGFIEATTSSFSSFVVGKRNATVEVVGPEVVWDDVALPSAIYTATNFLNGAAGQPFGTTTSGHFSWTVDPVRGGIFRDEPGRAGLGLEQVLVFFTPNPALAGSGTIKLEVHDATSSASDELTVTLDPSAFSVTGSVRGPVMGGTSTALPGEEVVFTATVVNGQGPWEVCFEFDDLPTVCNPISVDNEVLVTTTTRSFEVPGSKVVRVSATDANSNTAATRVAINIKSPLQVDIDGPRRLVIGELGRYDIEVSGAQPPVGITSQSIGSGLGNLGVAGPDPVVGNVATIADLAQATIKWTPDAKGTYELFATASDALERDARASIRVRVSDLKVTITAVPSLIAMGDGGVIAGMITGGTPPYELEISDDRLDFFDSITVVSHSFELPITFAKLGRHEVSAVARADGFRSAATAVVDVSASSGLTERTWVKVGEKFNPDNADTFSEAGTFTKTITICEGGSGQVSRRRIVEDAVRNNTDSDVTWSTSFSEPPEQVQPLDTFTLDMTVDLSGFHDRGRDFTVISSVTAGGGGAVGGSIALSSCALETPPCQTGGQPLPTSATTLYEVSLTGRFGDIEPIGTRVPVRVSGGGGACQVEWIYELMEPQP